MDKATPESQLYIAFMGIGWVLSFLAAGVAANWLAVPLILHNLAQLILTFVLINPITVLFSSGIVICSAFINLLLLLAIPKPVSPKLSKDQALKEWRARMQMHEDKAWQASEPK